MDTAVSSNRTIKFNRWLPYWAVVTSDIRQTVSSWIYRLWVLVSAGAAVGFLVYRVALTNGAGMLQPASQFIGDLLEWTMLGSLSLVVILTVGCISSERGTMADSVLSRAISRHQYFMGKWHSRLFTVLVTYLVIALVLLIAATFLLHEDLTLGGSAVALVTVAALLVMVVTCGVTVSATCNSAVLGIMVLWVALYGGGFALSLLPERFLTPDRALTNLPEVLKGYYDLQKQMHFVLGAAAISTVVAAVGTLSFARRDV
jgi:ABC-2 type transport system permease protein